MPLKDVKDIKIIVDNRELRGKVIQELFKTGAQLDIRTLPVADYVVSERVGIEFKTANDFESSIIDGRLFNQCEKLIDSFDRPIIIVLGNLLGNRIHPNAIRGAVASITTDYNIPVINVDSPLEAAMLIIAYARREQGSPDKYIRYNPKIKAFTDKQFMESIIAAFPKIGIKLAQQLLQKFGSIKGIVNASLKDLMGVQGIALGKAQRIIELINKEYDDKPN